MELYRQAVRLSGFFQSKNKPHQLLGGVGNGNIVVLTLGTFLRKVSGKGGIPKANKLGGIKDGKA